MAERRWVLVGITSAALLVGALVVPPQVASADTVGTTLSVTPSTNLPTPASVTTSGTGYTASSAIDIEECAVRAGLDQCSLIGTTTANSSGAFSSATVNVNTSFSVNGYGTVNCLPPNDCFVMATDQGQFKFATAAIRFSQTTPHTLPTDFDGDGKSDLAVYRPSAGVWLPKDSSTGNLDQTYWGTPNTDIPLPADYDRIGKAEPAVYRPSTGAWFVTNALVGTTSQAYFGNATDDIPVPADYDGDGKTDLAVFRPSAGLWLVKNSSNGALTSRYWGATANVDTPVPGDYDGDGKADFAVYRQSAGLWFVVNSSNGATTQTKWGNSSDDVPVPGRYDSDTKTDLAVYRPSAGAWFVLQSTGGTNQAYWGQPGDVPMPGDYDGDAKTDFVVFRRSVGAWFLSNSTAGTSQAYWGNTTNDVPLALPYAVRHAFFPSL